LLARIKTAQGKVTISSNLPLSTAKRAERQRMTHQRDNLCAPLFRKKKTLDFSKGFPGGINWARTSDPHDVNGEKKCNDFSECVDITGNSVFWVFQTLNFMTVFLMFFGGFAPTFAPSQAVACEPSGRASASSIALAAVS